MKAPARLAAYGVALALTLGASFGAGKVIGPLHGAPAPHDEVEAPPAGSHGRGAPRAHGGGLP